MMRLIALLVLAAVALAPTAAQAKPRAKVYRGTFQFVGADGDYVTGRFGHAHLVDGRRNDKLSVHVRRLAPRTRYLFRLQQAPEACEEGAPGGTDVPGWRYRRGGVLRTNRKGVANGSARSHRFRAKRDVEYFVAVYTLTPEREPGELILCAELQRRGKGQARSQGKGDKNGKDKPRGRSEQAPRGEARGHSEDKPRGRSEEAPRGEARGHDQDKARGNSEEKARGESHSNGDDNGRGKGPKKDRR